MTGHDTRRSGSDPLLEVHGLTKHYPITEGILNEEVGRVRAVDGISFDIAPGETVGLVGESGCGKSTAATSLLRIEEPTGGDVLFNGEDITDYDKQSLKEFRRQAQMIFQNPDSSFDPRMSIGESVAEPLWIHGVGPREYRREIVQDLLERVGLGANDVDRYPHEFSGGQKQRIALARAMVVNPELIVADEPVSALDVSIQAEVLTLIDEIQAEFGVSILLISHDLSVVREVCDRVAVMYLGEIVELADTETLFADPKHPYTRSLLASIPSPDPSNRGNRIPLSGNVPDPANPPSGCRFHTRCPAVIQPKGYDFEQDHWRSVMDLRLALTDQSIELNALKNIVSVDRGKDISSVSDDELAAALRTEYGIPDSLSDPSAEDVLNEALEAIVNESLDAADELLATEFATVCEKDHPRLHETVTGHSSACHLYNHPRSKKTTESAASTEN
ncbi:ABC transporter ATP-binding protein [Halocatena marina]|uniref:ABC transporter ATP-binding protein n=1 Tax=Halocatena marina TaxID=2934937 RepID=UPI0020107E55|nr:oligopeptide/dipeptide ABC transporter ATP-binding protein [Halocatena marina]